MSKSGKIRKILKARENEIREGQDENKKIREDKQVNRERERERDRRGYSYLAILYIYITPST